MKKFKVYYTRYSNMEWQHWEEDTIVEAMSKEEAKRRVEDLSSYAYEFKVKKVEEKQ